MEDLVISSQLMLFVGDLMLAFALATVLPIRASATPVYQKRDEMLATQTETAVSLLKRYYDLAMKEAAGAIRRSSFGSAVEGTTYRPVRTSGSVPMLASRPHLPTDP